MSFLKDIVGAVTSPVATIATTFMTNRMKRKAAERQIAVQQASSDTAHQRQVADLRAAGLNPILSGTGGSGASTIGGAMADVQAPELSTALQAKRLNQEMQNLTAQEDNTKATTELTEAQASKVREETKVLRQGQAGKVLGTGVTEDISSIVDWMKNLFNSSATEAQRNTMIKNLKKDIQRRKDRVNTDIAP